jgi:hypothetical protein
MMKGNCDALAAEGGGAEFAVVCFHSHIRRLAPRKMAHNIPFLGRDSKSDTALHDMPWWAHAILTIRRGPSRQTHPHVWNDLTYATRFVFVLRFIRHHDEKGETEMDRIFPVTNHSKTHGVKMKSNSDVIHTAEFVFWLLLCWEQSGVRSHGHRCTVAQWPTLTLALHYSAPRY